MERIGLTRFRVYSSSSFLRWVYTLHCTMQCSLIENILIFQVSFIAGLWQPFSKIAKQIFEREDSFSCKKYRFKGVIASSLEPAVVSLSGFFETRSTHAVLAPFIPQKFKIIVFGWILFKAAHLRRIVDHK